MYLTNVYNIVFPMKITYELPRRHYVLGHNQEANYICMPFNHQKLCFVVEKWRYIYHTKKVIHHFIFLLSSSSIRHKQILKKKKNPVLHTYVMVEDEKASHYYYIWCRICLSLDRMIFAFSNELFTDRRITFNILGMNNNKPYFLYGVVLYIGRHKHSCIHGT